LKSFWEASARAKMKTYLLSVGKNLGAAKRNLIILSGYLPCRRSPVSQTGGDITLIIGQK